MPWNQVFFRRNRGFETPQVEPELAAHDLAHLPRYRAAVRLCHAGETGPALTLTTKPLDDADPERPDAVRAESRARNGTERAEVEAELVQRQTRRRRRA